MNPGTSHTDNSNSGLGKAEDISAYDHFEQQYLSLRRKENRIYTDEELINLPDIRNDHPYYKEWLVRKKSFQRLFSYLQKKQQSLKILVVGCGNGWLSHRLAMLSDCEVTGIDINRAELEQAARVFRHHPDCTFLYGDIHSGIIQYRKFDVIIFAASLQYFSSLTNTVNAARALLSSDGEMHILDSHFYNNNELEAARQRSIAYFNLLGAPGMSVNYFHHSIEELKTFRPSILYNPFSFPNRFLRSRSPFYWICINTRDEPQQMN
jgi:SAM-dependent methyltransferase